MRIHFVVPYQSVAMRRMSTPLITELAKLHEVTTSAEVDVDADLNYHIPWHTMVGLENKGSGKHAIAYTHCNAGSEGMLLDACERADLIICMTFTGRKELVDMGVDPQKLWVIYAAADQYFFRKRLVGIVGYPQPNGRKRESLLLDLAWNYDMTPFQFIFTGLGWDDMVGKLNSLGVAASTRHAETDEEMQRFYQQIDLLLVTGYREGGPLPLIEAMASGANILSPRFGYAADLLNEEQLYETLEDLADKLERFAEPLVFGHKLARAWRWQDYCSEHALVFGKLFGESVDLYPKEGAGRYAQLLDVIDQIKPRRIVEIGTWNGNRAMQMIQAASRHRDVEDIIYQGFDLFESQTAGQLRSELSKMGWEQDVVQRRLDATLAKIELIAGNTRETLGECVDDDADLYFIDGGHSEETIENDASIMEYAKDEAVFIFDDYYHRGKPDGMGCNKFIDNLDIDKYKAVYLPARTVTDDGREIGMVEVRKCADVCLQ